MLIIKHLKKVKSKLHISEKQGGGILKLKAVVNTIKQPKRLVKILGDKNFLTWMNDETYLKLIFRCETGKKLNLKSPVAFNEKLQWLKLYDKRPEYSKYVDKYEVRDYIRNTIGEQYLIPLIGVYDKASDIPWDMLPDKFVLKCTHGSHSNIICTDKKKLNIKESTEILDKWMNKSWYWFGREWPYKKLKPRILCEEFISENDNAPEDYKVMCFHGKAKLVQFHKNRFRENRELDFYDINWGKKSISFVSLPNSKTAIPKPVNFDQMIIMSEILSKDKYYVRIDWYIVRSKLYFGEITLYDASGFHSLDKYDDDLMMGSWITLPID